MSDTWDCMPSGLVYRAGLTSCPTTKGLLASLAGYNVEAALLTILLGHAAVRRRISVTSCFSPGRWNILSACVTTVVHVIAMVVASIVMRVNGFWPNIFMLFMFWTMRPRGAYFSGLFYMFAKCFGHQDIHGENPYLWTLKDHIVEDTLLNLISLPCACWYIIHRPSALNSYPCTDDPSYIRFWNTFYAVAGVGGLSLILAGLMIHHWLTRKGRRNSDDTIYTPVAAKEINRHRRQAGRTSGFWKFILVVATFNMVAAAVSGWIIWARTDFCPGSLTGQGVAWGVALFLNAIIRPFLGGPVA